MADEIPPIHSERTSLRGPFCEPRVTWPGSRPVPHNRNLVRGSEGGSPFRTRGLGVSALPTSHIGESIGGPVATRLDNLWRNRRSRSTAPRNRREFAGPGRARGSRPRIPSSLRRNALRPAVRIETDLSKATECPTGRFGNGPKLLSPSLEFPPGVRDTGQSETKSRDILHR
jgi:hypothetical protein